MGINSYVLTSRITFSACNSFRAAAGAMLVFAVAAQGQDIFVGHPRVSGITSFGHIERITTDGVQSVLLPAIDNPHSLLFDAEGNLYYTNKVFGPVIVTLHRLNTGGGITDLGVLLDTTGAGVASGANTELALGPDGCIYVTRPGISGGAIGAILKVTPGGLQSVVVNVGQPFSLVFDVQGNLYYTDKAYGPVIVTLFRLNTDTSIDNLGVLVDTTGGGVDSGFNTDLAIGPDGNVYYTHPFVSNGLPAHIGMISPDGTKSVVLDNIQAPHSLAFDAQGNLYYSTEDRLSNYLMGLLYRLNQNGTVHNLGKFLDTTGGGIASGYNSDIVIGAAGCAFCADPPNDDDDGDCIVDELEVAVGADPDDPLDRPSTAQIMQLFDAEAGALYSDNDYTYTGPGDDLDLDGLPDRVQLSMLSMVLANCQFDPEALRCNNFEPPQPGASVHDAVTIAYIANLQSLREEPAFDSELEPYQYGLAALLTVGMTLRTIWVSETGLTNSYETFTLCAKSIVEPFTGQGSLGGDGVSNESRYVDIVLSGGSLQDFLWVLLNAGTPMLGRGGTVGFGFAVMLLCGLYALSRPRSPRSRGSSHRAK